MDREQGKRTGPAQEKKRKGEKKEERGDGGWLGSGLYLGFAWAREKEGEKESCVEGKREDGPRFWVEVKLTLAWSYFLVSCFLQSDLSLSLIHI